ncbi:hypothetical protein IFR04_011959 [Cadophora malorum]|uniref:Uncharacterized protein n=1 Tax=Cadophora malorum TaxID=108018 RepID=A0A8H7W788_9HELO|nr:hypothetical protein IFR04_011959 [Cadophora malorum]
MKGIEGQSENMPSQSVPERRASLRGRPKTADMPWAAYKRLPELDKGKDKQNIDGRGYRFRVTNRPTTYRDNNGEPENIGDYSSYKEARDFIQHHLSTLDDDDGLILTQKVDLIPEGGDNQTLLRVIGPDWDITIVAHYIWDEAIYLSSQPDAIEDPRMWDLVAAKPAVSTSQTATNTPILRSSTRSSKDLESSTTGPVAKRHKYYPKSSIRDVSKTLSNEPGEVEKPLPPNSIPSEVQVNNNAKALTSPLVVYTVKETSFQSFKAQEETILGLFTTLADAIKQVRACWEACTDRKLSVAEYLDGYHEDGRLWWTCRDEVGNGWDIDIELNIVKRSGLVVRHDSEGNLQKFDSASERVETSSDETKSSSE